MVSSILQRSVGDTKKILLEHANDSSLSLVVLFVQYKVLVFLHFIFFLTALIDYSKKVDTARQRLILYTSLIIAYYALNALI
jgi:hypothetical protein